MVLPLWVYIKQKHNSWLKLLRFVVIVLNYLIAQLLNCCVLLCFRLH